MQLEYTLQFRDEAEAAGARFPGDPLAPARPAPGRGAVAWILFAVLALAVYLLLSHKPAQSRAAAPGVVESEALADLPNPMQDNVFAAGAVVAGLGAIFYAAPLAYLLGRRRSLLPIHPGATSVHLDDTGLTLRTGDRQFTTLWTGVVALAETKSVFVLKTMGDLRLTLPKRAAGEPERIDYLRSFLRRHVTPLAEVADTNAPAPEGLCS
jgi:hypothetical protein